MLRTIAGSLLIAVSLPAQDCRPGSVSRDADSRCACIKDPASEHCKLQTAMQDAAKNLSKGIQTGLAGGIYTGPSRSPQAARATAAPRQARVVNIGHKDYLRFLHPSAKFAAGIDVRKLRALADATGFLPSREDLQKNPLFANAFHEVERMWISFAGERDFLLLLDGRFETGSMANVFYSQGVYPVFLGDASAMLVGPPASVEAALARLRAPAAPSKFRELSAGSQAYLVVAPPEQPAGDPFHGIRQIAFGLRIEGEAKAEATITGATAESIAALEKWLRTMQKDALTIESSGTTLRVSAQGFDPSGSFASDSALAVKMHPLFLGWLPGQPKSVVSTAQMQAVREGMAQEELVRLAGRPIAVSGIQGLETPRETWTYQIAFGRQVTIRLDGGVVTAPPDLR